MKRLKRIFILESFLFLFTLAVSSTYGRPLLAEEPALPEPAKIVYTCGFDDNNWLDMGSPYSTDKTAEIYTGDSFPAAIYGTTPEYYLNTINLHFTLETPEKLALIVDLFNLNDELSGYEELHISLNGKPVAKPAETQDDQGLAGPLKVFILNADMGENVLTFDMSQQKTWNNCWFDYIRLYCPVHNNTPNESNE